MDSSLVPSLSDFVDETNDDSDDAETMTAAQVLEKLEEVTELGCVYTSGTHITPFTPRWEVLYPTYH